MSATSRRPYRYVQRLLRHGVWRHYLRKPGLKRVALVGDYGREEFAASYRAALTGETAAPSLIGASRTVAGSLNAVIIGYKLSKLWTGLSKNSQRTRIPIMERLRTGPWGAVMVGDLAQKHVKAILGTVPDGHARKHWLKSLRALFAYAVESEMIESDPSAGIKVKVPKSDGYWTWTDEEITKYRDYWPLGSEARLVLEFALETASRRCEVARLGRQHVKAGRILIRRVKGCNEVNIQISAPLAAAIAAMPASDRLTYLAGEDGQPLSPNALGKRFAEWATEAGLPDRCRMHGLRKSMTAQLASSGASPHQIMAVTGHKSVAEVQRYAEKYNRAKAADQAMALLKTGTA